MSKARGFEIVRDDARVHKFDKPTTTSFTPVEVNGKRFFIPDVQLPTRADPRSAGYDIYLVSDVQLLPGHKQLIFTDVKAYMQEDEVLEIYIRSSLAIKQGLMLSNNVGIVDSSYYGNEGNDGNIGISIVNTGGTSVTLKAGERIAQGIFKSYLKTDNDSASGERTGGFGSSGK
jgi:dUTP pyrophosphatase